MTDQVWRTYRGPGPLVATAIHDAHDVRDEVRALFSLADADRLREEDPFTGRWTEVAPTRVIGLRSRFEVDLNRPRDKAVYRQPSDAWGLQVWRDELPDEVAERSLAEYDAFYDALGQLYADLAARHGAFVVYDLHTYNHRRAGRHRSEASALENPQVNIGTGTMSDRSRFAPVIDRFMRDLSEHDFPGGKLDVRENIKFQGGNHARWAHERFPESACVIAVEFKKFFMDEWSGEANDQLVDAIGAALTATVPGVIAELDELRQIRRSNGITSSPEQA